MYFLSLLVVVGVLWMMWTFVHKLSLLASESHNEWVDGWRSSHQLEPRIKQTFFQGSVNINYYWKDLDWKWKVTQMRVMSAYVIPFYLQPFRGLEGVSSLVHDIWMVQEVWRQDDEPHLFVPYSDLDEKEKDKDRVIARLLLGIKKKK